jgi:hypothetical protein
MEEIDAFAFYEKMAIAGDPDILSDFIFPPNVTVDENYFTFTY